MRTVTHHGRETMYRRVDRGGSGPGCCFVHGSGGNRRLFNAQLPLADRVPVTALDLSGHGDSQDVSADAGYPTLSAYADDVLAVLDETGDRVLVGNSLGGAVILHLLIERDPPVDAVVLVGTGARLGVLGDLLEWLESDFERAIDFLHEPGRLFADPDPAVVERSKDVMRETGRRVASRDYHTCHRFDVRDQVSTIDVPAMVIYGAADQLTPPWFHEYLATELPDAELVEIEDAAHMTMIERPEAFNGAIESFLADRFEIDRRTE